MVPNCTSMPAILLLAVGLIAYSYLNQGKAAYAQLQYAPDKIKIVKPGIFSTTVDIYFTITNNTNTSATVKSIDGIVKTPATQLGTFSILKQFTIPAGGSVQVVGRMVVSTTGALKSILDTLKAKKTPAILFDGGIQTELLGRIPFKYTADLGRDLTFLNKKPQPAAAK